MRKILLLCLTAASVIPHLNHLHGVSPGLLGTGGPEESEARLQIHNWVLARPADKPITVLDLTKRLELIFRQQYPEYAKSNMARFQFYTMTWRQMLEEMIDTELILADASEKKVQASDGDIRQQLEQTYGPNVPDTLNQLGLSYEDAWEMVRSELVTSEMRHYMIFSRALLGIGPKMVQEAYNDYRTTFTGKDEWTYQVLTLRHHDKDEAERAAKWAQQLLQEHPVYTLQELNEQLLFLRGEGQLHAETAITLSEVETRDLPSLASSYKAVLQDLSIGVISEPTSQKSRAGSSTVFRLFALLDHHVEDPKAFAELETQLQNQLLQTLAAQESKRYREQLRKRYGIDEDYLAQMIPSEFAPYELK